MKRHRFEEADLETPGSPFRLADIQHFTGLSRPSIMAAVEQGALVGFQMQPRSGSPWLFKREDVRRWWRSRQHLPHAC